MDKASKIRAEMRVVSAEGRAIGIVTSVGAGVFKITSQNDGRAFEHAIPLAWVSEVERYVFLNKSSRFVAANWDGLNATGFSRPKPKAA